MKPDDRLKMAAVNLISRVIRDGWPVVAKILSNAYVMAGKPYVAPDDIDEQLVIRQWIAGAGGPDALVASELVHASIAAQVHVHNKPWTQVEAELKPLFGDELTRRMICKTEDFVKRHMHAQRFMPQPPRRRF